MTLGVYAKAVTQEKRAAQAVVASLFGLEADTEITLYRPDVPLCSRTCSLQVQTYNLTD